MSLAVTLLTFLALSSPAPQDSGTKTTETPALRVPTSGIVRDRDGEKIEGARVVFVSRPLAAILASGDVDRVEARTDARGRVRVALLRGRDYSAWAIAADNEHGDEDSSAPQRYRTGPVRDAVRAGGAFRLVLSGKFRTRMRIRVLGLEKWKHRGPLRIFAMDPTPETVVRTELELDTEGHALLPELPGNGAWVEIDDAQGRPIWQAHVTRADEQPDPIPLHVAPPKLLRIVATDNANTAGGSKLAEGAEIRFGRNAARIPLILMGKLDAKGRLELELAYADAQTRAAWTTPGVTAANELAQAAIVVSGRTRADAFASLADSGWKRGPDGVDELHFGLMPGTTATGRLMLDKERPAAHARLLLYASLYGKKGGGQIACAPQHVACDADGRFEILGRSPSHRFRLTFIPTPRQRAELEADGIVLAPEVFVAGDMPKKGTDVLDLGTIRVDELAAVDVQGIAADGRPTKYPWFLLAENTSNAPAWPMRARGDRRGRVRFLVPDGLDFGLWLATPRGVTDFHATAQRGADEMLEVALDSKHIIRGQVLSNRDGEPVAGAQVVLTSLSGSGRTEPYLGRWSTNRMLAGMGRAVHAPVAMTTDPRWQVRLRTWGFFALAGKNFTCDARGKFEIALPRHSIKINLAAFGPKTWKKGSQHKAPFGDFLEMRVDN